MGSNSVLIAIIIVNYKVPQEICQLLRSLKEAQLFEQSEVIIVDNDSQDNSQPLITNLFPQVQWIGLKTNIGFGKACNIGAQKTDAPYLLFINPDTLVSHNTLRVAYDFMQSRPEVGIMGPKIIKPDGSFQHHSRRGFPTPAISLMYFLGLHKLFPKNPTFGKYIYSHISPDVAMEVDAISGSFIFIRTHIFRQINGFDKAFFMYGEDLDLCARCKELGYSVWYFPQTQIIHYKGKSSTKNLIQSRIAFYEAMIIFSKKYRHSFGSYFPDWLLTVGGILLAGMNITAILAKSLVASFIDLVCINTILFCTTWFRFHYTHAQNPYSGEKTILMITMHALISLSFLLTYTYRGIYLSERYNLKNVLVSSIIASGLFLIFVFFLKSIAFSRLAFALSALLIPIVLIGWRELLPYVISNLRRSIYTPGTILILGNGIVAKSLIKHLEKNTTAHISGILWSTEDSSMNMPAVFEGYPVLGSMENLKTIMEKQKIDLLLIATRQSWYSAIIELLSFSNIKNINIKWVPHELFDLNPDQLPSPIPLNDFSV